MPTANRVHTTRAGDSINRPRPLPWRRAMTLTGQAEAEIRELLAQPRIPRTCRLVLERVLAVYLAPIVAADGRRTLPVRPPAEATLPKQVRTMTDEQVEHYRALIQKGYRKAEALAAALRLPAGTGATSQLTRQQIADRRQLTRVREMA